MARLTVSVLQKQVKCYRQEGVRIVNEEMVGVRAETNKEVARVRAKGNEVVMHLGQTYTNSINPYQRFIAPRLLFCFFASPLQTMRAWWSFCREGIDEETAPWRSDVLNYTALRVDAHLLGFRKYKLKGPFLDLPQAHRWCGSIGRWFDKLIRNIQPNPLESLEVSLHCHSYTR